MLWRQLRVSAVPGGWTGCPAAPTAFASTPAPIRSPAIIKPWPIRPAVPGGFTVDEAAGVATCPAGHTRSITTSRTVGFGAAWTMSPNGHAGLALAVLAALSPSAPPLPAEPGVTAGPWRSPPPRRPPSCLRSACTSSSKEYGIAVPVCSRGESFNTRAAFLEVVNDTLGSLAVLAAAAVVALTAGCAPTPWRRCSSAC